MYWSFTFTDFGYFQRLSAVVPYGFCSAETFQKLTLASPKAFLTLSLNEQLFFLTFLQSCKGIWQTLLMTLFCFHGRAGVIWNTHNVIRIVTFFSKALITTWILPKITRGHMTPNPTGGLLSSWAWDYQELLQWLSLQPAGFLLGTQKHNFNPG